MCSINLDESARHMSKVAWPSNLYVLFTEKLDSLLDRLDNQCMMHGFQSIAIDCWCRNRNDTHYCSGMRHPHYKYLLRSLLGTISHSSFLSLLAWGFSPLLSAFHQWRTREALNASALPLQREVHHPVTPRLHHRRCLGLHHHQDLFQRSLLTTLSHRCLSMGPLHDPSSD
jgi:hypothetical protein